MHANRQIFAKGNPVLKGECAIFTLKANKNKLEVLEREPVTSGSVNAYTARFEFSNDWQGLTRKAVFQAGKESRAVLLDESGQCVIPWEVLTSHGHPLMAGVFGTADDTALPTTWASLGVILEGVPEAGEGTRPPTPDIYEQIVSLAAKAGETAQAVRDDADAGKFDGPPGPKGDPGSRGDKGEKGDPGEPIVPTFSIDASTGMLIVHTQEKEADANG